VSAGKNKRGAPLARKDRIIARELGGELLIYDLTNDHAHCLNRTAAIVWKGCDGTKGVGELAEALRCDIGPEAGEEVVRLAIRQLGRRGLLEDGWREYAAPFVTRRELLTKYLPTALALPAVMSIVAPTEAQAVSCLAGGLSCTSDAQCCSNNCVINTGHGVCSPLG
jgi:hypothetical protein